MWLLFEPTDPATGTPGSFARFNGVTVRVICDFC
jgi:hypothetical protein